MTTPQPTAPVDTCVHGRSLTGSCRSCEVEGVKPRTRDRITLITEWRTLIHNVHKVGDGWHWRCGVAEFRDEACQYDQRTDSYDAMIGESLFHLRRHHGIEALAPVSDGVGAATPADPPTAALFDIASHLDSIAAYQDRPGAMADVEQVADSLRQMAIKWTLPQVGTAFSVSNAPGKSPVVKKAATPGEPSPPAGPDAHDRFCDGTCKRKRPGDGWMCPDPHGPGPAFLSGGEQT